MRWTPVAALVTFIAACEQNPAAGRTAARSASQEAASAAPERAWVSVDSLGVQVEHAPDATILDAAGKSVMISDSRGQCTIILGPVDETTGHLPFARTVAQVERGVSGALREWIRKEETADGFVLQYTRASLSDPSRIQHAVTVRKTVGETVFNCSRSSNDAENATCILAACQSIKAN